MAKNNEETMEEKVEEVVEETTEETKTEATEELNEEETVAEDKKDPKDKIIEELTDKYKRTFAEFDNFRKRSDKEKAAMYEIGAKDIIEKVLPVVDNFERGLAMVSEED